MRTASVFIPRTPQACWKQFTDAALLPGWVPGLRRATVITSDAEGAPIEVSFEFDESMTYTLVYSYDRAALEVRWEPRVGRRDAVRGIARFAAEDAGTRVFCSLEERGDGELAALLAAFQQWMNQSPGR